MTDVPTSEAYKLFYPRQSTLVTSFDSRKNRPNVMVVDWAAPLSFEPPLVGVSVGKTRYSHSCISDCRCFVVAFPTPEMSDTILKIGSTSGRDTDKFRDFSITAVAGKTKAPLVRECFANVECELAASHDVGDHTLFVGRVVAASAKSQDRALLNVGGRKFKTLALK